MDCPAIEEKVNTLLAGMNLAQKVGQMTQAERMFITPEEVRSHHIGSVLSGGGSCPGDNRPSDWVEMNDAYWMASMEADAEHLAIPVIYGVDAIHGHANVLGATVFPHNIGLGACRDPVLIERIAATTAREILATGVDWTFAPTLAVARNDRWGRTYESYAEDPSIVAGYADRFVRGMQGNLGEYLDCGFMPENNGFMFDSLFCEWAYVINLDTEKLEVYRGFNTVEGNAGRYASHLENAPFHREAKYYGVALIIEIPLSYFNSLSMADEEIEELMGDIEGIFYMRIENEDGEMVDDTRTAEERRVAFNEKYPSFTTYEMKEEEEEYA
jgi:hypothetical protein